MATLIPRCLVLLIILLAPALGCGESLQKQFVIGSWIGPHQTEAQYLLYKQAGFNTVLDYPWEGDNYKETLRLTEKVGDISAILNIDHNFLRYKPEPSVPYERIAKFVNEVKGSNRIIGYLVFDEPVLDEPNVRATELLTETGKYLRSLDPGRMNWINFYPLTNEGLARSIIEKSRPSVISTCYYPYNVNHDRSRLEKMYPALEQYRSLALQSGTPLWLFVQSVSQIWQPDRKSDMRMPTAAEMRLQVYANLAYGAKGLWYYTYAMPRNFKDITAAILDKADKPTPVYDSARQLNKEVLALGPLLMRLMSVDVMHVGPKLKGVKSFVPNDLLAGIDGDNLLLGFFKDASGGDYFMLVNKLPDASNKNIRLKLGKSIARLFQIDKVTGKTVKYGVNNGVALVNLGPGDGILLKAN